VWGPRVFRLDYPEQSFEDNLRRAVKAEFDRAIGEVGETGFEIHGTVRNVRRRLKRVRAVLKLVRPVLPAYREESESLRDLGADVSALRDAQALVEAVDRLAARRDGVVAPALLRLRRFLAERAAGHEAALDRDALLSRLREQLREARVRAELWEFSRTGAAVLVPGFVETYQRARGAAEAVAETREQERFHEWRKRAKDHWAQLGLLRGLAPEFAEGRRQRAGRLVRTLGDYQNLSLLLDALRDESSQAAEADAVAAIRIASRLHGKLGKRALKLGRLLFADKPRAVDRRWRTYWDDWEAARRMG
jgi:hypothetical protein